MCLGIPGEVLSIDLSDTLTPSARVSFGGIVKQVCLAYTPEAKVGDFVIVHVGFAISLLDREEARKTFEYLDEIGQIAELAEEAAAMERGGAGA
jgi:hydrogenase expression/formation protein HypC